MFTTPGRKWVLAEDPLSLGAGWSARLAVSYVGRLALRTLANYSFGRRIFLTQRATAQPNPSKLRHQNDASQIVGSLIRASVEGSVLSQIDEWLWRVGNSHRVQFVQTGVKP